MRVVLDEGERRDQVPGEGEEHGHPDVAARQPALVEERGRGGAPRRRAPHPAPAGRRRILGEGPPSTRPQRLRVGDDHPTDHRRSLCAGGPARNTRMLRSGCDPSPSSSADDDAVDDPPPAGGERGLASAAGGGRGAPLAAAGPWRRTPRRRRWTPAVPSRSSHRRPAVVVVGPAGGEHAGRVGRGRGRSSSPRVASTASASGRAAPSTSPATARTRARAPWPNGKSATTIRSIVATASSTCPTWHWASAISTNASSTVVPVSSLPLDHLLGERQRLLSHPRGASPRPHALEANPARQTACRGRPTSPFRPRAWRRPSCRGRQGSGSAVPSDCMIPYRSFVSRNPDSAQLGELARPRPGDPSTAAGWKATSASSATPTCRPTCGRRSRRARASASASSKRRWKYRTSGHQTVGPASTPLAVAEARRTSPWPRPAGPRRRRSRGLEGDPSEVLVGPGVAPLVVDAVVDVHRLAEAGRRASSSEPPNTSAKPRARSTLGEPALHRRGAEQIDCWRPTHAGRSAGPLHLGNRAEPAEGLGPRRPGHPRRGRRPARRSASADAWAKWRRSSSASERTSSSAALHRPVGGVEVEGHGSGAGGGLGGGPVSTAAVAASSSARTAWAVMFGRMPSTVPSSASSSAAVGGVVGDVIDRTAATVGHHRGDAGVALGTHPLGERLVDDLAHDHAAEAPPLALDVEQAVGGEFVEITLVEVLAHRLGEAHTAPRPRSAVPSTAALSMRRPLLTPAAGRCGRRSAPAASPAARCRQVAGGRLASSTRNSGLPPPRSTMVATLRSVDLGGQQLAPEIEQTSAVESSMPSGPSGTCSTSGRSTGGGHTWPPRRGAGP